MILSGVPVSGACFFGGSIVLWRLFLLGGCF
jgi:hypothetical protein